MADLCPAVVTTVGMLIGGAGSCPTGCDAVHSAVVMGPVVGRVGYLHNWLHGLERCRASVGLPVGRTGSLALIGWREHSNMALASTSVKFVRQIPQNV